MVTFNEGDDSREFTQEVMDGLRSIEGVKNVNKKDGGGDEVVVEWQNHDPDVKFESALSIDYKRQELTEMTLRFGPVGTYDMMDMSERQSLEADWADVVLDASMATRPRLDIDGRDIDLGDMYISDYARPHLRLTRKPEGYKVSAPKLVEFLRELNQRHKRQFGTLQERIAMPEYEDILELR